MEEYVIIGVFSFLGLIFVGGALITTKLIGFRSAESDKKHLPYECGIDAYGDALIRFKVGYFIYALIFLLFDVESLFLFPCLRLFKKITSGESLTTLYGHVVSISNQTLLIELGVFILILVVGLIFAWRKGVLEWE